MMRHQQLRFSSNAAGFSRSSSSPWKLLCLMFAVLAWLPWLQGQGLDVTTGDKMGSNSKAALAEQSYRWNTAQEGAKGFNRKYNSNRQACSTLLGTGVLCGEDTSSSAAAAALLVATSPPVFDTRNTETISGRRVLAPRPKDQGDCNLCVAYSVSAAAQAAAAAALQMSSTDVPAISARQLHFCGKGSSNDCVSGWRLQDALRLLTEPDFEDGLEAQACMPIWSSAQLNQLNNLDMCQPDASCTTELPKGSYAYTKRMPLMDFWQIQQHIRQHGASVVTRMTLPDGFKDWFKGDKRTAVYDNPKASNDLATAAGVGVNHAVVIAGYNNLEEWWLIWSSWGEQWADGGFAKVKYGQLGIGDASFTYGIMFQPLNPPLVKLPLGGNSGLQAGCVWYTVQRGDYVSGVAARLGLSIEALLQANTGRIDDLGAWLKPGSQLAACGVKVPQARKNKTDDVYTQAAPLANAFCISPDFRKLQCAFATEEEISATEGKQCHLCGTLFAVPPKQLPSTITNGGAMYNKYITKMFSLSCKGRVVVRTVFKILKQPSIDKSQIRELQGSDCSGSMLINDVDQRTSGYGGEATNVVRCELQLPSGPGSEAERAVRSKEVNCFFCELCSERKGCPAKLNVWYSDSYTTRLSGCDFDPEKGYRLRRAGININPKTEALLAKFEACSHPGCFDPVYEDAKLQSAGFCYQGRCDKK